MKKLLMIVTAVGMAIFFASTSFANVYTFVPSPEDIWGLDHSYYYTWGIEWDQPVDRIANVVLTFTDIYDWRMENGDSLYVNMLDNPDVGTFANYEGYTTGNYFEGQGEYLGAWSDPLGGAPLGRNVSFDLYSLGQLENFKTFASDGVVGFGFDPDCHYYNSGVKLTVYTAVPEPATFTLIGLGLLGMGVVRKFRK